MAYKTVFAGNSILKTNQEELQGGYIDIKGEKFYKISNYDRMLPFFMSIVSDSNHWMFISSKGGLTAGRKNPENAIFPYNTDDKIHDSSDTTGSKTILYIEIDNKKYLWEPFSDNYKGLYSISRNIYKNVIGNKLLFEEVNDDLQLTFSYEWLNSDKFGFIKKSQISNNRASDVIINLLDGVQNILPASVDRSMQTGFSTLVDAYKKCELLKDTGIAIYSLSSIPVDRAEPSESLKASIVWPVGLENSVKLLSSRQLDRFRFLQTIDQEFDVRAARGAYFQNSEIRLQANSIKEWYIVIDTNKDISDIIFLQRYLTDNKDIINQIENDIDAGTRSLKKIVANADGLQLTNDELSSSRHFSNVLFNVMRGGILNNNYLIDKQDFIKYFKTTNKLLTAKHEVFIDSLQPIFLNNDLIYKSLESKDADLTRICYEYLPLTFSRRHGDPSRPWNVFSIETKNEDGSKILYYQGNWRDIFQNWEALAFSFPGFIESMICKFVNASTSDGYNPYRITREGFDWEVQDPHDPWSFIGFWGDHQVIYLLKLLEVSVLYHPGSLDKFLIENIFSYANVPYRIKPYTELLKNPQSTILFDEETHNIAIQRLKEVGSDGKLVWTSDNKIYLVNLTEKILVSILSKFVNFIPEAGIWMNTQRPEWNDANNALVGNGVSMVTLYYMRRFQTFFEKLLKSASFNQMTISEEVAELLFSIFNIFKDNKSLLNESLNNKTRKILMDQLGMAGTVYREKIYKQGFSGKKSTLTKNELSDFCKLSIEYIDHTIKSNKRDDKLFHAYNLMTTSVNEVSIKHLYEMLEGQVAVLSSGYLTIDESLELLVAMKKSALYRPDQYSYLLYPDRQLPLFIEKNFIKTEDFNKSELLKKLIKDDNKNIVVQDINGNIHFHSSFRNAHLLKKAIEKLENTGYKDLVIKESVMIQKIYEKIFNHSSFTGRSGTFYKYEGLGCIYWHMVAKLLLAVKEIYFNALKSNENKRFIDKLYQAYYDIRSGLGVTKSPALYGAFPTDPYSHTPGYAGVQQPGMTGQVKEDILTRFAELGVFVDNGKIVFNPALLQKEEFLQKPEQFIYYDLNGFEKSIELKEYTLAFTFCQVLIVYHLSYNEKTIIVRNDNTSIEIANFIIEEEISKSIFDRNGEYTRIDVYIR